jgi:electron-transferring-flavoprotein dehydrogenase
MVNIPALKGIHYAIESGRLAAEAAVASFAQPEDDLALRSYDDAVLSGFIGRDLWEVRDIRQAFGRGFFVGGALAGVNLGRKPSEPDVAQPVLRTDRAARYPVPDGKLTFDKLSSVYASGNQTRDDQPNHIRLIDEVPPEIAEMWAHMCPAAVYAASPTAANGLVTIQVAASNCVQCGAISAKGGRLTPPEGGSGPEYSLT